MRREEGGEGGEGGGVEGGGGGGGGVGVRRWHGLLSLLVISILTLRREQRNR